MIVSFEQYKYQRRVAPDAGEEREEENGSQVVCRRLWIAGKIGLDVVPNIRVRISLLPHCNSSVRASSVVVWSVSKSCVSLAIGVFQCKERTNARPV